MPGVLLPDEPESHTNTTLELRVSETLPSIPDRTNEPHDSTSQTLDSPPMFEDSLSEGSSIRSTTIHHVSLRDFQTNNLTSTSTTNPNILHQSPNTPSPNFNPHAQAQSPITPDWTPEDTTHFLTLVHQGLTLRQVHAFFPDRTEVELWQYLGICWRDRLFRVGNGSDAGGGTAAGGGVRTQAVAMAGMAGRTGGTVDHEVARAVAEVILEDMQEKRVAGQEIEEVVVAVRVAERRGWRRVARMGRMGWAESMEWMD